MSIASPLESDAPFVAPHGRKTRLIMAVVPGSLERLALQLHEDWVSHGRDSTLPGFRAVAVHRFGTWVEQEAGRGLVRGPIRMAVRRLYILMYRYIRNHYGIELPHTIVLGRRVVIGHQSGIVIHERAKIGDDCVIRQNVTIGLLNAERGETPTIGRGVEIGAGAAILGGITVGDGSRIGPHSVVMIDVPPGSTVFVNAPRIITLKAVAPASPASPESPGVRESRAAGAAR
jgi:serine O-acetyltransferase